MNVNVKSTLRRTLAVFLCVAMLMSILVVPVCAAETAAPDMTESDTISFTTSDVAEALRPTTAPEETTEAATEEMTEAASEEVTEAVSEEATEAETDSALEVDTVTNEAVVLNATVPQVVTGVDDLNATVKIFNYDDSVNTREDGLGPDGYVFFQGDYADDSNAGSVDGKGSGKNTLNQPSLKTTLVDGYPYVENTNPDVSGSMAYLFSDMIENSYHKGTMTDGGGLFQKDAAGYYYYDSMKNAASFDGTKFTLYDTVVRPNYTKTDASDIQRSNFLPFNPIFDANNKSLVTVDTKLSTAAGSVQAAKLNNPVDLWFGMTVEFDFFMPKNGEMNGIPMEFDFHGDDDVFVYIDDVLVLNIIGTHGSESATINFKTGIANDPRGYANGRTLKAIYQASGKYSDSEIEAMFTADGTFKDYTKHNLKFFYMERGGNISYCRLRFNMPTLPPNSLTVGKELTVTGDGTAEDKIAVENSLSYQFRVWQSDAEGNVSNVLFVKPGTTYDILEGTNKVGTGTVGTDGCFSLKAGQQAQFTDMLTKGEGIVYYVVEEILPGDLAGQYGEVEYMVDESVSGTVKPNGGDAEDFSSIQTGGVSAEDSQIVVFKNKVNIENLGTLKVTKALAEGANFEDGKTFQIQVKLGDVLLPVDTEYKVGDATRMVATAGILDLAVGETAVLEKMILSGTEYEITELIGENDQYQATYTGTVSPTGEGYELTATGTGVEGKFPLGGVVEVTVTNENFDFSGQIPITKTTVGNSGTASFQFAVDEVTQGEDGKWNVKTENVSAAAITVTGDTPATANAVIAYDNTVTEKTFFYKVYEKPGTDSYIYDPTYYIVEVYVGNNIAKIRNIWKNGTEEAANVAFVNQKLTSIIVTKKVLGIQNDAEFTFTATFNGVENEFRLANNGTYEITNIPVDAQVTVTEKTNDGYHVYYQVGNGAITESNTATLTATEKPAYINFTNASYVVDDTVVIDYGLPVDVNVLKNDVFADDVTVSLKGDGTGTYGSAEVKDNLVRYTPANMQMKSYDEFTYSVPYSAVAGVESTFEGTLTIIPATTIYYEDDFVAYEVWSKETGTWEKTDKTWSSDGTVINGVQAEDRPGEENANNYGYDGAYDTCSTYSMGTARYVTAGANTYGTATFTFYGTGFDVIGMTNNNTGTITVKIYQGTDTTQKSVKNLSVDTYYGYTKNDAGEWVVDNSANNSLYQVPVISYEGLTYGQYTVVVKCAYNSALDHQNDASYNFYLDAIRIYDPAGAASSNESNVISDAYKADGEAYPVYQELRASIIEASNVTVEKVGMELVVKLTNGSETIETLDGAVFIDGIAEATNISDYVSYGPNNELYLAKDQAIGFKVKLDNPGYKVVDVQIGVKSANGQTVQYTVNDVEKTVATSTDMYYSIVDAAMGENGDAETVVIANESESILSLTNVKVTYEVDANAAATMAVDETSDAASLLYVDADVVTTCLKAAKSDGEVEEPTTEATESETTEATEPEQITEATESETTEPEQTTEATEVTEPEVDETEEATTEPEESETETPEPSIEPTEETKPETEGGNDVTSSLRDFLRKLFGWLFR